MEDCPALGTVELSLADGIARVLLNRPDKLNALSPDLFADIVAAGEWLATRHDVRVVVLAGAGRAFCAGLDLASMGGGLDPQRIVARTHGNANLFQQVAMVWRKLPVPVIAALHGVCFGGGLQIASGADIRVAAPDTRMSIMEMKWGIVPDMGGYALWRGLVRDDHLRELTYTFREFTGAEGATLGLVTMLDADPLARATALAGEIVQRNPEAVRAAKRLFNSHRALDEDAVLLAESVEQAALLGTANQREAVASQLQRRPASFVDPA
ncbi:MAG: crotonase/enoyl-CoA hydratase family protein [Proteobacteria bacterium]|nr:crotonase/enoyl-CoA hydratase family protein [Pseudomonadota bacterium]